MHRSIRLAMWGVAALVAVGTWGDAVAAQRLGPEPKRKRSAFVADTNDAMALYNWGLQQVERDPSGAADAFYWAARINPSYAEPLYGRRVALLLSDPGLLRKQMARSNRGPTKEIRQLDSLVLRALTINPFLFRRFDRALLVTWIKQEVEQSMRQSGQQVNPIEIDHFVETYLRDAGPEFRGWMAYSISDFTTALSLYAQVEKAAKQKADVRIDRGRIFAMRGEADSAIAQLSAALAELRAKESKELVVLYNSKSMLEHSIGTLLEGKDDVAGAREAYGRALQEDLAFYPSHVRLGLLALGQKDTTTALTELELATQVAGDEPYVRFTYGFALAATGKIEPAREQLQKAIELEPLYAPPHAVAGRLWEQQGDAAKAAAAYEAFLARAARNDVQRPNIAERLADMKTYIKPKE